MADTKETGAPSTEPRVKHTGGADVAVAEAARKAQADEAKDEGAGKASVPVEDVTTANDK